MSDDFVSAAMQYGLRCIGKEGIVMKPEQLEAVRQVCLGKDVFLWLPTGFGKSLCYELLPFVMDFWRGKHCSTQETPRKSFSTVIVISPLVSLMIDQVTSHQRRGVSAAILTGHSAVSDELVIRSGSIDDYSFVFSCPEAVVGVDSCRELLLKKPLSQRVVAVIIDEAHCVSKWYSIQFRTIVVTLTCVHLLSTGALTLDLHMGVFIKYVLWFLVEFNSNCNTHCQKRSYIITGYEGL